MSAFIEKFNSFKET